MTDKLPTTRQTRGLPTLKDIEQEAVSITQKPLLPDYERCKAIRFVLAKDLKQMFIATINHMRSWTGECDMDGVLNDIPRDHEKSVELVLMWLADITEEDLK